MPLLNRKYATLLGLLGLVAGTSGCPCPGLPELTASDLSMQEPTRPDATVSQAPASASERGCEEELKASSYPVRFEVQVVTGSLKGRTFRGAVNIDRTKVPFRGAARIPITQAIFCYRSGAVKAWDPGVQLEVNDGNVVRVVGAGGDSRNRFGLNAGFERSQFARAEEGFIRRGQDYFGYLDERTYVDGAGVVSYTVQGTLGGASGAQHSSVPTGMRTGMPAGMPTGVPIGMPTAVPHSTSSTPSTPPFFEEPVGGPSEVSSVEACALALAKLSFPLRWDVRILTGSMAGQHFYGAADYDASLISTEGQTVIPARQVRFCYRNGLVDAFDGAPQLEFDHGQFVRLSGTGGDIRNRFGFNGGFERYQFGRWAEDYIRRGEDYFGYLDPGTFVDGAGIVTYTIAPPSRGCGDAAWP